MESDEARPPENSAVETDDRFPSGEWTGFFLQPNVAGRSWMELLLTFVDGVMSGEGRDWVGAFLIKGRYEVESGKCRWTKSYVGMHDIFYQGYNEGRGVWGVWEFDSEFRGGFHIWPIAMGDPTMRRLAEEADAPVESEELELVGAENSAAC